MNNSTFNKNTGEVFSMFKIASNKIPLSYFKNIILLALFIINAFFWLLWTRRKSSWGQRMGFWTDGILIALISPIKDQVTIPFEIFI
jgi:hypothetical protein